MSTITEQLGRVLAGRYRLEAAIGTGTSAHVYAATDTRLGRRVAVKVLHPGLAGDESFVRRFRAEAQAAAALSHPNILAVFDWGFDGEEPYLVAELVSGGSLADLLDAGRRLSVAQAARLGAEAARGLAYAHRRGFVHRDVKPANLLLDAEGTLRIADFGLARALAEAAWTEPVGAMIGTARYASPEQAEGRRLDDRSDVYSLALVLFETVVGRAPFSGDTTISLLAARVGASLPAAGELGPLAPILAQAAIAEPLARLDAAELASQLELLVRHLPAPDPVHLAPIGVKASDLGGAHPSDAIPDAAPDRAVGLGGTGGAPEPSPEDWFGQRPVPPTRLVPRPSPGSEAVGGGPVGAAGNPRWAAVDEDPMEDAAGSVQRRRRWPRRVAAALAACVLLLGGAAAVWRFVMFADAVPHLAGRPVASARVLAQRAGVALAVAGRRYSSSVPTGDVISESPAAGRRVRAGTTVSVVESLGPAPVAIPTKLATMSEHAALAALARVRLAASIARVYEEHVPAGVVVAASPASGLVTVGSRVRLLVSKGPAPRTVPGLGGSSWSVASARLTALRLVPVESIVFSDTVPAGEVVATTPAIGTTGVVVGTDVVVDVSKGPRLVAVPVVTGDLIAAAVAALDQAGLQVTEQIGPPFATKASTTEPGPGAEVRPGTSVTLYVA